VGLTHVVPFLVEDELKAQGGHFSKTADWGVHVVTDGLLITGQNPASSGAACDGASRFTQRGQVAGFLLSGNRG
jgi:putative intracellular protease/amidase